LTILVYASDNDNNMSRYLKKIAIKSGDVRFLTIILCD
jgi:hypothetical protein